MLARAALLVVFLLGAPLASVACGNSRPAAPLVPRGMVVGLGANSLEGGFGREQDRVRRLGIGWLREEVPWPQIERAPGRFDFRAFDRMLYDASIRRMRVLPVLLGTPKWLSPHERTLPPAAPWARFTARVVARYGPDGTFWRSYPELDARLAPVHFELWNEPWLVGFSRGGPDPRRFAALQRAAVSAGRTANPRARFLLAAEGPYRADGAWRHWLEDLYAADPALGETFDAVSVHPYSDNSPLARRGDLDRRFGRLDDVVRTLDERGAGARPLWLTEIGWSTCSLRPRCVSEDSQARNYRQMFQLVATRYRARVAAVFTYHLRDYPTGRRPDPFEQNFGVLRVDGTRKPAWSLLRRAAIDAGRRQEGAQPLGSIARR